MQGGEREAGRDRLTSPTLAMSAAAASDVAVFIALITPHTNSYLVTRHRGSPDGPGPGRAAGRGRGRPGRAAPGGVKRRCAMAEDGLSGASRTIDPGKEREQRAGREAGRAVASSLCSAAAHYALNPTCAFPRLQTFTTMGDRARSGAQIL